MVPAQRGGRSGRHHGKREKRGGGQSLIGYPSEESYGGPPRGHPEVGPVASVLDHTSTAGHLDAGIMMRCLSPRSAPVVIKMERQLRFRPHAARIPIGSHNSCSRSNLRIKPSWSIRSIRSTPLAAKSTSTAARPPRSRNRIVMMRSL